MKTATTTDRPPGHDHLGAAHLIGMTSQDTASAHTGHDLADVSISWGGYEVCDTCCQVLAIENDEGDIVWQAGRPGDTAADCRHYLGASMTVSGLTPATSA